MEGLPSSGIGVGRGGGEVSSTMMAGLICLCKSSIRGREGGVWRLREQGRGPASTVAVEIRDKGHTFKTLFEGKEMN